MTPCLISIGDLVEVLNMQNEKYFIQIQSDGSYKVNIKIDKNSQSVDLIEENIMNMIAEKNKEREEKEEFDENVNPLIGFEMVNEEELEFYPHFDEYFENGTIVESEVKEQLNSWFRKKNGKSSNKTPIVTFYSYKGGVGRSTSLAITARLLANEGYRVVVLDFDLEAPGQLTLLAEENWCSRFGITDYLIHKPYLKQQIDSENFLKNYIIEIPKMQKQIGSIYLMPAGGRCSNNYLERLSSINFDRYLRLRQHPMDDLFSDIQAAIKPDVILIDSRTGFADVAGTLLFRYSDLVSVHVYNNKQNKLGIKALCEQITAISDITEESLQIIWTHTSVLKDRLDKHEELQEYLINQLQKIYSKGSKKNKWAEELDKAYLELGYTLYDKNLDGADNATIVDFVKNGADEGYNSLKDKIKSLITRNDEKIELSKEDKLQIISELKFGNFTAETDDYNTFEEFKKNFLLLDGIEDLLSIDTHLILGSKGTGKSALFKVMRKYENELIGKFSSDKREIVMTEVLANPKYYKEKEFIKYDDIYELEKLRKKININEMIYWKRFWKIYLWIQFFSDIEMRNANNIQEWLKDVEFPQWVLSKIYDDQRLLEIHECIINRSKIDEVSKWFDIVDLNLKNNNMYLVCLYDHLDKLFEDDVDLQERAVGALLSFWDDGEFRNIVPKIFLRKDIYSRINIQNHSHWLANSKEIKWTKNDLHRLILKRTIEHSEKLKNYIEMKSEDYLGYPEHKFKENIGIEIPTDDKYITKLLNLIFGVRMGTGKKSGLLENWFYNHLRDANDNVYPRDTIHLLKLAQQTVVSNFSKYLEKDRIISSKALANSENLSEVSEQRFSDLDEEYKNLSSFLHAIKKCKFTFINKSKNDIILGISQHYGKKSIGEIEKNVDKLIEIGVLKEYKNGNIAMPDLYLRGFDAQRPGPL